MKLLVIGSDIFALNDVSRVRVSKDIIDHGKPKEWTYVIRVNSNGETYEHTCISKSGIEYRKAPNSNSLSLMVAEELVALSNENIIKFCDIIKKIDEKLS